jgi:hypothetical protein
LVETSLKDIPLSYQSTLFWGSTSFHVSCKNSIHLRTQQLDVRPPRPEAASSSPRTTTACFNSVAGLACVTGNVFTDAVVGPSGTCPAGTFYLDDITSFIPDVRAFLLSLGFPPTGDICA